MAHRHLQREYWERHWLTCNVWFGLGLLNSKMDEMNAPNLKNNPFSCFISFNIFNCLYTIFFSIFKFYLFKLYFANLTHHLFFFFTITKMPPFFF